jgi:hypothetical protein
MKIPIDMTELLSLTPLEYILIGLVALGIFLFFRACWHNIQQSSKAFTAKRDRGSGTSSET